MIARLGPCNILFQHACNVLNYDTGSSHSWFYHIWQTCSQYKLPDPISILTNPPTKDSFKNLVKSKVVDYWESILRVEAAKLPSLVNFKPMFYSLVKPHPIWTFSRGNPYEVEKACVQARMISGRYRTCWLSRHWSGDLSGMCSLPLCRETAPTPGTLHHIIFDCPDLSI